MSNEDPERDELRQEAAAFRRGVAYARAHAPSEVEGLFGPSSLSWTLYRELGTTLFGASSALLLQLAHPAISAGVRQHSEYAREPLARSRRTFAAMQEMVFGPCSAAVELAGRVFARHRAVRGVMQASSTAAPERYRALDPAHLLWVHSTLLYAITRSHELLVRPLAPEEKARLYEESKRTAALMGLLPEQLPEAFADWEAYVADMFAGPVLGAGNAERALGNALFSLTPDTLVCSLLQLDEDRALRALLGGERPRRWHRRFLDLTAAAFLPEPLREGFGLRFGESEQARFRWLVRVARRTLAVTPPALRYLPAYHRAMARVALARGGRPSLDARVQHWLGEAVRSAGKGLGGPGAGGSAATDGGLSASIRG